VIAANLAANTFQMSILPGGTAFDFTVDASAGSFVKLTEVTGGSPAYARTAIVFATAANEISDDSTNGANPLNVPAGGQVDYVALTSHVSTALSTANILLSIQPVTQEVFAGQGTYTITNATVQGLD
jgi:hypothetical protein